MSYILLCPQHLAHIIGTHLSLKNKWNEGIRRLKYGWKDRRRRKSGDGDFKMWSTAPGASWRSNRVIRARAPTGFSIRILTKATSVA